MIRYRLYGEYTSRFGDLKTRPYKTQSIAHIGQFRIPTKRGQPSLIAENPFPLHSYRSAFEVLLCPNSTMFPYTIWEPIPISETTDPVITRSTYCMNPVKEAIIKHCSTYKSATGLVTVEELVVTSKQTIIDDLRYLTSQQRAFRVQDLIPDNQLISDNTRRKYTFLRLLDNSSNKHVLAIAVTTNALNFSVARYACDEVLNEVLQVLDLYDDCDGYTLSLSYNTVAQLVSRNLTHCLFNDRGTFYRTSAGLKSNIDKEIAIRQETAFSFV